MNITPEIKAKLSEYFKTAGELVYDDEVYSSNENSPSLNLKLQKNSDLTKGELIQELKDIGIKIDANMSAINQGNYMLIQLYFRDASKVIDV